MRGGGTETDGVWEGREKGAQTGEEFEKDETGQHKREREE